jgi:hypothetical protein
MMLALDKPLVTDADDVLINWVEAFRRFASKHLNITLTYEGYTNWDMSSWLGLPYEETIALVKLFNASEAFAEIPHFECAGDILPAVAQTGRAIHVVTSCARDADTQRRRRKNLETLFGPIFTSITCLDLGESKLPALIEIADKAGTPGVWAEDNHKNGKAGADIGYDTFMFRRGHNREHEATCDHPKITWVSDWHAVAPHLIAA